MKTTQGSAHRHKDSRGKWVTEELPHTHDVDLATLTAADIATLKSKLGVDSHQHPNLALASHTHATTPPPVDPPPVEPPVPPSGITFGKGFGRNATGGSSNPTIVTTTAQLEAAVRVAGAVVYVDAPVIEHGPMTLAERVTLQTHPTRAGGATLLGEAIELNNHDIVRNIRLHRKGASGTADILWAKFDKHDIMVSGCDIAGIRTTGEPDGWTDFTRNCTNITVEFCRYIGLKGYGHNATVLLSNGTRNVSWHHNHVLNGGDRHPACLYGDSNDFPPMGATEIVADSVGNVLDGITSYGIVVQQFSAANDRYNTYNMVGSNARAFDVDETNSKLYSVGTVINGPTPEPPNSPTRFPSPDDVLYGLTTAAQHAALTLAHAGVRPLDAVAAAAMAEWGRV